MNTKEVRIERLPEMRVARFHAFGQFPEREAWTKLLSWVESHNLLRDPERYPVFGFNNPGPSAGEVNYGYEFWLSIEPELEVEPGVETLDIPAAWYAVTTHEGFPNPDVWMELLKWVRSSQYRHRPSHELERPHDPLAPESEVIFDLYLPIEPPDAEV